MVWTGLPGDPKPFPGNRVMILPEHHSLDECRSRSRIKDVTASTGWVMRLAGQELS